MVLPRSINIGKILSIYAVIKLTLELPQNGTSQQHLMAKEHPMALVALYNA